MKFFVATSVLFLSYMASADIVVLNFNRNQSTVSAAKKAAIARGEKVIEIPKGRMLNEQSLNFYLEKMKKEGVEISSIVFSGHDGGGYFSGLDGSLSKVQLSRSLAKYPNLTKNVKSLVLRGCYTGTLDQTVLHKPIAKKYHWQNLFPNLNMLAGYSGGAPSSEKKESTSFVEEVLTLENKMYMSKSLDELNKLFTQIPNSTYTSNSLTIRRCQESDKTMYSNMNLQRVGHQFLTTKEVLNLCNKEELLKKYELYQSYFYAHETNFHRTPKKHHGTDLREAYSYLQENYHCLDLHNITHGNDLDILVRLIYFDYIKNNFTNKNGTLISNLQEALNWYEKEAGELVKIPDLKNASRHEIVNFIHKLYEISLVDYSGVNTKSFGLEHANNENIGKLQSIAEYLNRSLFELDPEVIPFDWVANKNSKTKSSYAFDESNSSGSYSTQLREEEAATFKGLSIDSQLQYFLQEGSSTGDYVDTDKDEQVKIITEGLMSNYLTEISPGSSILDNFFESMDQNQALTQNLTGGLYQNTERHLSRNLRVKAFVQQIKEKSPYEAAHLALRAPHYFKAEEVKNLLGNLKSSKKFKTLSDDEKFLDIVNSLMSFNGIKENKFKNLVYEEFPDIEEKLNQLQESIKEEI